MTTDPKQPNAAELSDDELEAVSGGEAAMAVHLPHSHHLPTGHHDHPNPGHGLPHPVHPQPGEHHHTPPGIHKHP